MAKRFKSWYVTDDAYLYTLMCYIEQNLLKANIEGYSQHMIAKVLGMTQSTINGIVKRCG